MPELTPRLGLKKFLSSENVSRAAYNENYDIMDSTVAKKSDLDSHIGSGGAAHSVATTSANGFMTAAMVTKLNGIATSANNYSHPTGDGNLHVPANGTSNNGKFLKAGATAGSLSWSGVDWGDVASKPTTLAGYGITDASPSNHGHSDATTGTSGFMSAADKSKLNGIAANANNYSHPSGDGNLHVPATSTTNNNKVLKAGASAGSVGWDVVNWGEIAGKPTTLAGYGITDAISSGHVGTGGAAHAAVTTSTNGFMTASDKQKLDGIAANANNYTHPTGNGNLHVPPTGSTTENKVLKSGPTAGNFGWEQVHWGEIAGKPTTRAGYGITDALSNTHEGTGGATHAAVTTSTNGFMTAADKQKLDGIAAGANNYTHPATHSPSIIVQDANNRFVTDAEKAAWNAKAGTAVATTSANGLMWAGDKLKLDGIAANANNYTHPSTHPATMITTDANNRFVSDAEKAGWNSKASTAVATTGANGLMSASDKGKLDGIAANANNYSHPSSHPASMITEDANRRFVSDTEKATWNAKASTAVATTGTNGLMSAADKVKLNGARVIHIGTSDPSSGLGSDGDIYIKYV